MAKAQLDSKAVYMPPRGMPVAQIPGYAGYDATIVFVGPVNTVSARVKAPAGTGPYTSFAVENVPYCDADTPPENVPLNGGYVAPVGFTPPAYTPPPITNADGVRLAKKEVIWANPNTTPTTTALDSPVLLPLS